MSKGPKAYRLTEIERALLQVMLLAGLNSMFLRYGQDRARRLRQDAQRVLEHISCTCFAAMRAADYDDIGG